MTETESISLSVLSNTEKNKSKEIKWTNDNDYPIRCPQCCSICLLDSFNISEEKFVIKCENQHENIFNSFNEFSAHVIKNLNKIICNKCQCDTTPDLNNMERCNECFLIFCKNCISEHKEKHENSMELDKIDTFCYRHNLRNDYFNNDTKYHICKKCYDEQTKDKFLINYEDYLKTEELFADIDSIDERHKHFENEMQNYKKLMKSIDDWEKSLLNKLNKLKNSLNNYYDLKKAIIEHLFNDDNYDKYNNNFYVLSNYEMFTDLNQIESFVGVANFDIKKNKDKNFVQKSGIFLNLINDFLIKSQDIKQDKIRNLLLEKNRNNIKKEEEKSKLKLSDMKSKNKYKFTNDIKCFTVINEKYIILGCDKGEVNIYESKTSNNENAISKKLSIKEFKNPIKFICEIDNNIIAISDKIGNIKIIEFNEDATNYSLIQEIKSEENKTVHTMIYLPILSYYKNRHHFCMANRNNIFIYKSNKQPKNLFILKENYHDTIQEISIEQPTFIFQESNTLPKESLQNNQNNNDLLSFNLINKKNIYFQIYSLIEINEKYIAAACFNSEDNSYSIKFFDVNNNFELKKSINTKAISGGSYIMNLVENRKVLVIGCINGFQLISTKDLRATNSVKLNMSIISIGVLYDNTLICCTIEDKTNFKQIIEFRYNADSDRILKSDDHVKLESEIWDLKCFNKKIYYILNSSLNIFEK